MTTKKFGFLADFKKAGEKMEGVSTTAEPPRYFHSFGNFLLNAIMTGSYDGGVAQSRVQAIAGPSGSGKSFLAANAIREAQKDGAIILVCDSENALDDEYMEKIGVDTSEDSGYYYRGVRTMSQVITIVSSFIKGYRAEFGQDREAPKVLIVIDSLDMLMTDTEFENYNKSSTIKGDQGQISKQRKSMLRMFVQDIKELNISMLVTHQVYKNQDLLNGEGTWVVNGAVKYSLSQIVLVTALKLREGSGAAAEVTGIRLRAEGYKTRFTQPYQKITLEVPYGAGMDPYSGLLEAAVSQGLVKQSGAWYTLNSTGDKFQRKSFDNVKEKILQELIETKNPLMVALGEDEEEDTNDKTNRKKSLEELIGGLQD